MFDLQSFLDHNRNKINEMLSGFFDDTLGQTRIIRAMKYSLMAKGKRVRPILCIASAQAIGPVTHEVFQTACAIEMVHTYSLIHDDLPAMDNDDLRRGNPTSHIEFDEATAILAGDALLTIAFQTLASLKIDTPRNVQKWLEIIQHISTAAGYQGMIEGQMRDMAAEGKALTLDELKEMHQLKTGCLIEASVVSGALINSCNNVQLERLRSYAKNIGLAFQISDDILDVSGDSSAMGKNTGTDRMRNKSTYPSLVGIKKSRQMAEDLIHNALHSLDNFDKNADPLRHIASYIIARNK